MKAARKTGKFQSPYPVTDEMWYTEIMNLETTITNEEAREFLDPKADQEVTPEHEAWTVEQIEATMKEREAGLLTYRSLDEVMADFGFHAR